MFRSFMPTEQQLNRAATYGKLAAFVGLACFVEVAIAMPQTISSCFEICNQICGEFGAWQANDNCTQQFEGNYNISVNTGTATKVEINKTHASPIAFFALRWESGGLCNCEPTDNQEFATLKFPS